MQTDDPEIEATMERLYGSLNERDRRRYAGIEALKFGRGGRPQQSIAMSELYEYARVGYRGKQGLITVPKRPTAVAEPVRALRPIWTEASPGWIVHRHSPGQWPSPCGVPLPLVRTA